MRGPTFSVKLGPWPGFSGGVKVFCYTGHLTTDIHHFAKHLTELFFFHSEFSLRALLNDDFSLNHKNYMIVNSSLFCAYHEKLQ